MWSILYVFCVFQYGRLAKFSNRLIAGPSFSRPNLFCFDLVWANHIAGKYISRNGYVPDWLRIAYEYVYYNGDSVK